SLHFPGVRGASSIQVPIQSGLFPVALPVLPRKSCRHPKGVSLMSRLATRPVRRAGPLPLFALLVAGPAGAVTTRSARVPQPESLVLLGVALIVVAAIMAWSRRRTRPGR